MARISTRDRQTRGQAGLIALWVACVAGLVATFAVFVRTRQGQRIDQAAFEGRGIATAGAQDAASQLLTTISVGSLVLVVMLLAGVAIARRRLVLALVAAAVVGGSIVTTEILKHALLQRPDLIGRAPFANTFPSGHATIALGVGVAAMLVVPPRVRRATTFLALAYAVAVGIALLAAGWHRPSDVAGGYLVVIGWAAAAAFVAGLVDRDALRHAEREWWGRSGALGYLLLGAGALVAGYLVAVGAAVASEAGAIDWALVNAAFLGACAAITGVAALLVAGLLRALEASLAPASGGGQ